MNERIDFLRLPDGRLVVVPNRVVFVDSYDCVVCGTHYDAKSNGPFCPKCGNEAD
jgi:rubrerythrin